MSSPCISEHNSFLERFHRSILDEQLRIKDREKWYDEITEMQKDLDIYLAHYNTKRPHQGRNMNGRTPFAASREGIRKSPSSKAPKTVKRTST
ncbi:integrase core domain-containing protein [Rubritalea squalenifaciens]|uniref:integrase core domain-containing protein n=1 Tax=Rubritalea squalenifaciens TaxID=407226 RepID=UPI0011612D27|nr:integrase core domain-containing protein [Rubritalea squalenifaciens]